MNFKMVVRGECCAVWVMHNTTNYKLKRPIYICPVCMAFLLAVAVRCSLPASIAGVSEGVFCSQSLCTVISGQSSSSSVCCYSCYIESDNDAVDRRRSHFE